MVRDNVLQQGPQTVNHSAILAFGLEAEPQPGASLVIEGNLFVNDAGRGGFINYRTRPNLSLAGNRFVGPGRILPDGDAPPDGNEVVPGREAAGPAPYPELPAPGCM